MYPSRTDALAFFASLRDDVGRSHAFEGRLASTPQFPDHVDRLISELSKALKIPESLLDQTVESILVVERAIRRHGRKRVAAGPLLDGVLAYVGSVVARQVEGTWTMLLAEQGQMLLPCIVDKDGIEYDVAHVVIDEVASEEQDEWSLIGATEGVLAARRSR